MDILTLLIQLVSGAIGGNAAGSLKPNISLGTLGNTLAGLIGGGIGGQILQAALNLPSVAGGGALDPMALLTQIVSGGASGGVALALVSLLRGLTAK